jgi:hypothetical protein
MFGFESNAEIAAEMERLRNEIGELRIEIARLKHDNHDSLRKVAAAVTLLAESAQEQVKDQSSTTACVLGLMRLFQHHYGYEKSTPYGTDAGNLS